MFTWWIGDLIANLELFWFLIVLLVKLIFFGITWIFITSIVLLRISIKILVILANNISIILLLKFITLFFVINWICYCNLSQNVFHLWLIFIMIFHVLLLLLWIKRRRLLRNLILSLSCKLISEFILKSWFISNYLVILEITIVTVFKVIIFSKLNIIDKVSVIFLLIFF